MSTEEIILNEFTKELSILSNDKNLYIWGAGTIGKVIAKFLNSKSIEWLGFFDNNKQLWNKKVLGKRVYDFDSINRVDNIYILISLSYDLYSEQIAKIVCQIKEKGGEKCTFKIMTLNWPLINAFDYYVCNGKKTLLKNAELYNIFEGKRAFVIGNGPSLRIEDLNKISNEISFSCNGSITLVDKTQWRPTCFFCGDHLFLQKYGDNDEKIVKLLKECQYMFTTFRSGLFDRFGMRFDTLFYLYLCRPSQIKVSEDICSNIYGKGSSIFVLLQLAIYMGIKELYLIGCDFSFHKELNKNGNLKINEDVENHMKLMDQCYQGRYNVDWIKEEFLCIKKYAEQHDIKIYNATRGGKLEVFKRVDLDELF